MFAFKELICEARWYGLPCLDLDRLTPPRKEGDLPKPLIVAEDLDGELRDAGTGEGLELDPSAGVSFFRTPDMIIYSIPWIACYGRGASGVKSNGRARPPALQ